MSRPKASKTGRVRFIVGLAIGLLILLPALWLTSPAGHAFRLNAMDTPALMVYTSQHLEDAPGFVALARRMERNGNEAEAFSDYLQAARTQRNDANAWLGASRTALHLGDAASALQAAQEAVRATPTSAAAQEALGDIYAKANLWEPARIAYRFAVRYDPGNPGIWNALSEAAMRRADMAEALQAAQRSADLDGHNAHTLLQLARVHRLTGDLAGARQAADRAVQLEPRNPDALLEQGIDAAQVARTPVERDAAAQTLRRAAIGAGTAGAYAPLYQLGQLALAGRHWSAAEQAFRAALRVKPDDEAAVFALGRALALAGHSRESTDLLAKFQVASRYRLAVTQLRLRIEREPRRADLYARLADLHIAHNDWPDAIETWQRSLDIDPNQPAVRRRLNNALHQRSSQQPAP